MFPEEVLPYSPLAIGRRRALRRLLSRVSHYTLEDRSLWIAAALFAYAALCR